MRLTETLDRKVVGVADATSLGTVSGFVVHPQEPRLAALRLRRSGGRSAVLEWSRVRAVGADAVMVRPAGDEDGESLAKEAVKHGEVLGKRVLTETGTEIGEVTDAEFDPESGALLTFVVGGGAVAEETVGARRMVGLGSYALVLRAG
ncbi:PRC-barrel domain-containing protein [Streptomyces sp. TR06-5]|uniref:PRC-barrel domain-containing protein n=1 Tax=unclassified Streptomyces TaxID=2593676 RepID=UPI0039A3823A